MLHAPKDRKLIKHCKRSRLLHKLAGLILWRDVRHRLISAAQTVSCSWRIETEHVLERDEYPEQLHFGLVGRCINEWAEVEGWLCFLCEFALKTDSKVAAVVLYRTTSLRGKFDLVGELFATIGIEPLCMNEWMGIADAAKPLITARNRLAHQSLDSGWEVGSPPILFERRNFGVRRTSMDAERAANKSKNEPPIDIAGLKAHLRGVRALIDRLTALEITLNPPQFD